MLIQPQTKDGAIIIRKRFAFGSGFALIIYLLFRLAPFSSEEPPPGSGFLSGFFALPVRRAPTQSHPPSRRPNPRENSSLRLDTTRYIYLAAEQEKTSSAPGRSPRPSYLVPSALLPSLRAPWQLQLRPKLLPLPVLCGFLLVRRARRC